MFDFMDDYQEKKRLRFAFGILLDSINIDGDKKEMILSILRGEHDKEISLEWAKLVEEFKKNQEKKDE